MFAIEIDNLHKSFDDQAVLRGLNLHVPTGSVYGLVGPSAAGKSSLVRILLGFSHHDKGSLRLLGSTQLDQVRQRVGYLPQGQPYPGRFTPREFLGALGRFAGMHGYERDSRVEEEIRAAGLAQVADQPIGTLSQVDRQRFGIAQAMIGQPEILLLDEPVAGPDLPGDHGLLDLVASLRTRCPTILITTQRLDTAEYLCDRIGVLVGGQLAVEAETQSLRGPGRNALISVATLPAPVAERLRALSPAVLCEGDEIALRPNSPELQGQVLAELVGARLTVIALEPFARPIEDLYLRAIRGLPAELPQPTLSETPSVSAIQPGRPSHADTLLRELLKQEDKTP